MVPPQLTTVDAGIGEFIAELKANCVSEISVSLIVASIVLKRDQTVDKLLKTAFGDYAAIERMAEAMLARTQAAGPVDGTPGMTPSALRAIATYKHLSKFNQTSQAAGLLAAALMQFGPAEQSEWHPLDAKRLLQVIRHELEPRGQETRPSERATSSDSDIGELAWQNLSEWAGEIDRNYQSPLTESTAHLAFFDSICRSLHRSDPQHVIVTRERGVGDHAVLLELARQCALGNPPFLRHAKFVLIDCRRVPSESIAKVIEPSVLPTGSGPLVKCLDFFATFIQAAGAAQGRSALFAMLAQSRSKIVGILSPREYEDLVSGDLELRDLFSLVNLPEPPQAISSKLVRHFANGLQRQYGLEIEDQAVERAVVLSDGYILHERLPGKAVKILRNVCDDIQYDRSEKGVLRNRVLEADVLKNIASVSGIPVGTLAGVGEAVDYEKALADVIVGQTDATREIATELGLVKAAMTDPGKPASVMMFIGQTGTGKTETAKALARMYSSSRRLKTFTLGNFSEPHSVSGIIGVPAGYVGHDQGGRLVNELNADPYGVFLLDEADKAHPDVMQPFLNLFDEGWICDQKGAKAYADRAIFILTTNVGQRQIAEMCRNNKSIDEITSTMKETLGRIRHTKSNRPVFTAEFLARIKRFIIFRTLDQEAMLGICQRLTSNLQREWSSKRQKSLVIDETLINAIGCQAYAIDNKSQGREGGRIVRKLLADIVESNIQSAIVQNIEAYLGCEKVIVEYRPNEKQAMPRLTPAEVTVRFSRSEKLNSDPLNPNHAQTREVAVAQNGESR